MNFVSKKLLTVLVICLFCLLALGSGSSSDSENENISSDTTTKQEDVSVTIDEEVIFDQNDVVITAKEIVTDSIWGQGIKVLIENNSSSDVTVSCDALAVNGYMLTDFLYETVTAGQKANSTIYCLSSELKNAGISGIGEVDIWFYLLNPDTYERIYEASEPSIIKTSAYDTIDTSLDIGGSEILNQDGIRIVAKYVDEDSFWGKSVLIYAENNSGRNVSITSDDTSINGYMIDGYYYADIKDGYKAFDSLEFFDSTLEENGIEKIENLKLKFTCFDLDSYKTIFESDYVEINVD